MQLELDLSSPLSYAVAVSKAKQYRHVRMLDRYLVALVKGRLYHDGPGPAPVDSGEVDEDGFKILVHPTRGDRPVYQLAISMPPRHGKSYLVSEHLPAWFLSNYPEYSVLLASYEADFAAEWGAKVRDHIVEHPEYGITVAGGRSAARRHFTLDGFRGFMKCAGAGGPITGSGGQLIIVDDPIKNAQDAMSAIERDNLDNWWRSTLFTRREPWHDGTPCRIILMATRWHEDDLTGRRLEGDTGKWCVLNLQALFEPRDEQEFDPLQRAPGEALCPERFSRQSLIDIREEVGLTWFEAMYQGYPSLDEGNLIKRPFSYYTLVDGIYRMEDRNGAVAYVDEDACYRFATLDPAGVDKKTADYTVFMVFDVTPEQPRRLLVRSVHRLRIDSSNHEKAVEGWNDDWNPTIIHIEDRTFGTTLLGRLKGRAGMIVAKLKADANKVFRAMPIKYEVENEMVWFPQDAEWLTPFERELTKFPNTTNDDQVDCLAYGVQTFKALPPWIERKKEPVTMEERIIAHRKELASGRRRKRRIIPGIGRW